MFTGRVPLEEWKYDEPREYDELASRGELEERLAPPVPRLIERGFKIFGFIALGVGLVLIALIVYAMVFGYR